MERLAVFVLLLCSTQFVSRQMQGLIAFESAGQVQLDEAGCTVDLCYLYLQETQM